LLGFLSLEHRMLVASVGMRLKWAREAAELSRKDVADRVHRSVYTIAGYELGRIDPPLPILLNLASLYGVEVADLVPRQQGDLQRHIEAVVATAPLLSQEQRDRLALLLRGAA